MQSDCHVSVALHFTALMLKLWSWKPRCSFLKKSSIASLIDSNSRNKDKQNQTPTNICAHVLLNPIRHFLYTKYWLTAAACFCLSLSGLVWNEAEPEKTASAKGASVIVEPDPKQNYDSYLVMVYGYYGKIKCVRCGQLLPALFAFGYRPARSIWSHKKMKIGKIWKSLQACHALESLRFDFVASCKIISCVTVADSLYSCCRKTVVTIS